MELRLGWMGTIVAAFVLMGNLGHTQTVKVPNAKTAVMVDGKIKGNEWADAEQLKIGDNARIYFKQTKEYLWFALEYLKAERGTLDLYLEPGDGRLVNMHASAKLGQRMLSNGKWPEEWTWWNNEGWVANVARFDSFEPRRFLPETVLEYQISKEWFKKKEFRMMLEMMTKAEPAWITTPYPADATNTDPKGWMVVRLE